MIHSDPSIKPSDSFQIQQLKGPLSNREKLEATFAKFLGHVVKLLGQDHTSIFSGINQKIKEHLQQYLLDRNAFIEHSNELSDYKGRLSQVKDQAGLDNLKLARPPAFDQQKVKSSHAFASLQGRLSQQEKEIESQASSAEKSILHRDMKQNIQKKMELLNDPSVGWKRKAEVQKELQVEVEALRTSQTTLPVFKKIAKGKAKQVWSSRVEPGKAYFTPVRGSFSRASSSKEAEIRKEVNTAKQIQHKLNEKGITGESNLALEMRELEGDQGIDGLYTVETDRARCDMEDLVNKKGQLPGITFPESAALGLQVAKGIRSLHQTGHVHGDIKLENVLVYEKDGEKIARISDFGKTKPLNARQSAMHTGNPRFAAPEGRLSQQGEVYGSAIMIIRMLEGELLTNDRDMITNPKDVDQGVKVDPKRRGIEKFLVLNKDCPQSEVNSLRGKVKVYGREAALAAGASSSQNIAAQNEVHRYIEALMGELAKAKDPGAQAQIKELEKLLKQMTSADPSLRPSMASVVKSYEEIMK